MLREKKKFLITIALLIVAICGVSVAAYTLAGSGVGESEKINAAVQKREATLDGNLGYMKYKSNIDLIIEDSNKEDNYMYNILHIIPSNMDGDSHAIEKYVKDGSADSFVENFKKLVIDKNGNQENLVEDGNGKKVPATMKSNTVQVTDLKLDATVKLDSVVAGGTKTVGTLIGEADLIYIESPTVTSYTGAYAMDDDIYSYIKNNYAMTDHKPVIMDNPKNSGNTTTTIKTFKTLINEISDRYLYSPVFGWDKANSSIQDFLDANGNNHFFSKVINQKASGKILVLQGPSGTTDGDDIGTQFANDDLMSSIYYGKKSNYPDKFVVDRVDINSLLANSGVSDASALQTYLSNNYEFIIIENSAVRVEVNSDATETVYTALKELADNTQYIIYDAVNVDPKDSSGGNSGNKYLELYNNFVTSDKKSKYKYVLNVDNGFFEKDAASEKGAQSIADLINGSNYRGSENNGRNGKKFRVLELQPCYPIDTDLAMTKSSMQKNAISVNLGLKGNYYTNPGDVLTNTTKDEANGAEYYAFELSPAKIAKATGLDYSQIQVDQMSTDEFITRKDVVLDTYDFVYIGGNTSALTPYTLRSDFGGNFTDYSIFRAYNQSKFVTSYDMYTHTGIATHLQGYNSNSGTGLGGNPYGTIANTQNLVTDVLLNGNDITSIKLKELKDYIDAGMPIVFSDAVSEAYMKIYDKSRLLKLGAKDIDPDSNMFKLLDYAYFKYNPSGYKGIDSTISENAINNASNMSAANNIKWDVDITPYDKKDEYNDNKDKRYGGKAGDYVTVFNKATADDIKNVIQNSAVRPSLVLQSSPKNYSRGDESTYNTKTDNKMIIKAVVNAAAADNDVPCKLVLYVDQDGDGTFDLDEAVDGIDGKEKIVTCTKAQDGASEMVELTYEFPQDDFYGLVSWKLVASYYDENSASAQACDVKTGYAYYKRESDVEKKEVRTLQIMPVESTKDVGFTVGTQDAHTLYMCTECQLAAYKAKYNIVSESDSNFHHNTTGTKSDFADLKYTGLHDHKFGIVKYESNGQKVDTHDKGGADNYDTNYADELSDDYDFDLDIMLIDEFHEMSKIVEANTDASGNLVTMNNANGVDRKDENGNKITPIEINGSPITWVDYYQSKADSYYDEWQKALGKLNKSSCVSNMVKFLKDLQQEVGTNGKQGHIGTVTAEQIQQWINHEAYYNYFMYYSGYYADKIDKTYLAYYNEWTTLHDEVVKNHNLYKKYSCYAGTSDNWLGSNYDMVVLGFAEDFGGKDLTIQECDSVKKYVENGGSLLTTHDSTTRYEKAGSVNITTQLRSVFGIDRFHATLQSVDASVKEVTDRTYIPAYLYDITDNTFYGPISLTDSNVTVDLIKSGAEPDILGLKEGQNTHDVYKPYNVTAGNKINNGEAFSLTFNLYDTEQDAQNNKRSSDWGQHKFAVYRMAQWNIQHVQDITIGSSGTYTYKGSNGGDLSLTTSSDTIMRYPVYSFSDPKYFMTQKSIIGDSPEDLVVWQQTAKKYSNLGNGGSLFGIISLVGTTDSIGIYETASHLTSPYRYVDYNLQDSIKYAIGVDYDNDTIGGTNKATQVNKGIVTTYPFTLGENLTISPTHSQTYAADLEDSNMAVWYTLAGSSLAAGAQDAKSRSSLYAASPNDGMDNYFLYSYQYGKGTVHYCGAGHSVVTGAQKNNNDERMLYVNLVTDAVRNSASRPKIIIKDKDNNEITEESNKYLRLDGDGNYVYKLDNEADYPEFNFDVKFSSLSGGLSEVLVFYDLNYDSTEPPGDFSNKYTDDKYHVLIHQYTGPFKEDNADEKVKILNNKINVEVRKNMNKFTTKDGKEKDLLGLNAKEDANGNTIDYFANYGNYTYIVVWAKDAKGKTAFARIKITLQQTLFDLTDNTVMTAPIDYMDCIVDRKIDATNRIRFYM